MYSSGICSVQVLRDHERRTFRVPAMPQPELLLVCKQPLPRPSYLIVGGLVFVPLMSPYAASGYPRTRDDTRGPRLHCRSVCPRPGRRRPHHPPSPPLLARGPCGAPLLQVRGAHPAAQARLCAEAPLLRRPADRAAAHDPTVRGQRWLRRAGGRLAHQTRRGTAHRARRLCCLRVASLHLAASSLARSRSAMALPHSRQRRAPSLGHSRRSVNSPRSTMSPCSLSVASRSRCARGDPTRR